MKHYRIFWIVSGTYLNFVDRGNDRREFDKADDAVRVLRENVEPHEFDDFEIHELSVTQRFKVTYP